MQPRVGGPAFLATAGGLEELQGSGVDMAGMAKIHRDQQPVAEHSGAPDDGQQSLTACFGQATGDFKDSGHWHLVQTDMHSQFMVHGSLQMSARQSTSSGRFLSLLRL